MVVLLVAAVVICYLVWDNYFRDKKEEGKIAEEQSLIGKEENDSENIEEKMVEREREKEQVTAYEGEDPNTKKDLTGVVTYAGVSGDVLMIRVNIDQYLAEGNCELNLIRNGTVIYSDTTGIVTAATTATCEGFNVPISSLNNGSYQILINLSSDNKAGIISGEVNI